MGYYTKTQGILSYHILKKNTMTQTELSEFLDASALYYCRFKLSDISASLYKIWDDSVKLRHFLGTDNADEIEAILSDHEGHFLHEIIDGDEPLRPIIDFDLPIETLNAISSKLSDKQSKNTFAMLLEMSV